MVKEHEEQTNFLARSLAAFTTELKLLSSRQVPVVQGVDWNQPPASQTINYGPPHILDKSQ